jgi:pimeloyl-ACP methyl ester carboxylesterase
VLVGHSDGASIALLHPHHGVAAGGPAPLGIVSLSAHVLVEQVTVDEIVALTSGDRAPLVRSLSRHHDRPDELVDAWADVWTSDRFRGWTADDALADVRCPVVAVQGADDRYGSRLQLDRIAAGVAGPVHVDEWAGVDHWPHRDRPDEVVEVVRAVADAVDP